MFVSVKDVHRDYIGQCVNLSKRFYKHNSTGGGSKGTADPRYQPYFLAGYICGMGHLTKAERETLEGRWHRYVAMEINRYQPNVFSRLAQGQWVVEEYSTDRREEERITFVETMRTYNQEQNNDQFYQDNDDVEECKEQQQVEEEDELNAHDTIFHPPLSLLFPV